MWHIAQVVKTHHESKPPYTIQPHTLASAKRSVPVAFRYKELFVFNVVGFKLENPVKAPDALCSNKYVSGCKDKKYLAHLQNISLKLRAHGHLFSYSTFHNSFLLFKDENDVSHYF